jgi:hypothetical protein
VFSDIHPLGLNLDECFLLLNTNIVSYFIASSHVKELGLDVVRLVKDCMRVGMVGITPLVLHELLECFSPSHPVIESLRVISPMDHFDPQEFKTLVANFLSELESSLADRLADDTNPKRTLHEFVNLRLGPCLMWM